MNPGLQIMLSHQHATILTTDECINHVSNFLLCFFFTGLTKLESLNIKWCNCIDDADMKPLSGNLHIGFPFIHNEKEMKVLGFQF